MNYNNKIKTVNRDTYNNGKHRSRKNFEHLITNSLIQDNDSSDVKVKLEPDELDFESNITANSIIGKCKSIYFYLPVKLSITSKSSSIILQFYHTIIVSL